MSDSVTRLRAREIAERVGSCVMQLVRADLDEAIQAASAGAALRIASTVCDDAAQQELEDTEGMEVCLSAVHIRIPE